MGDSLVLAPSDRMSLFVLLLTDAVQAFNGLCYFLLCRLSLVCMSVYACFNQATTRVQPDTCSIKCDTKARESFYSIYVSDFYNCS